MSKTLWISQRFLLNEGGSCTVSGEAGTERILIELDPSIAPDQLVHPDRAFAALRGKIQAAARRKWEIGEVKPVLFAHSGRVKHHLLVLTAEDLTLVSSVQPVA